jgi:hypothetical protein
MSIEAKSEVLGSLLPLESFAAPFPFVKWLKLGVNLCPHEELPFEKIW